MNAFVQGLQTFLKAVLWVIASPDLRAWYLKRLGVSFLFVIFSWLLLSASLGYLLWELMDILLAWSGWNSTLPTLALSVGSLVLWLFILFCISGPLSLLLGAFYMSNFGHWRSLTRSMPDVMFETGSSDDSLLRKIVRLVALALLIVGASLLGLFPPLLLISVPLVAFAIGWEWQMTAADEWGVSRRKISKLYLVGLGLIPALVATLPFVSLLILPLMQIASSFPYIKERPH